MKTSEINLREALQFSPERGVVTFGDNRMIVFSADSFGRLLSEMLDIGGVKMTQVFMRRFGESAGRSDALTLKERFVPDTDLDWIAMGPTLHSWEGIVRATPTALEYDRATGKFFMQGTWENSIMAELYVKLRGPSTEPVCWMLSGYATGYSSAFFGTDLICKETMCVAKGDPCCQFTIKPKREWIE